MRALVLCCALMGLVGCAERIPADRYGVHRLRFEGVESFNENALRACLATAERERFSIDFFVSDSSPECGDPPFDAPNISVPLWRWWFTDWPLLDQNIFERDMQRIERWYRARGYYETQVTSASFVPESAHRDDHVEDVDGEPPCEREGEDEGCEVEILIRVEEGEPVLVASTSLSGADALEQDLQQAVADAWELEAGDRFDEALYDRSKRGMLGVLREEGYGCATIDGEVSVNVEEHQATVAVTVDPGPKCIVGEVRVLGNGTLSERVIRSVADIQPGNEYVDSDLRDAQHNVYGLGAFASVEVLGRPQREHGVCTGVVDVDITVTPGRQFRYGFGAGVELGAASATGVVDQSVPSNNIHLLGFIEHRNFLGGLRRMRLDVRPKYLFSRQQLGFSKEHWGGDVRLELRQPAFIESRTNLVLELRNDTAPDPFEVQDQPLRNNFDALLSIRRSFLSDRLQLSAGPHLNHYRLIGASRDRTDISDYFVFFFEQRIGIDLRDRSPRPSRPGAYFELDLQQAVAGDWLYFRVVPDFRVYIPLGPLELAGRFRLGTMHILRPGQGEATSLDQFSADLGPNPFRLRGGGANSHRGFVAGLLGDRVSIDSGSGEARVAWNLGGLRRWLASLELRAPLTENLGIVVFSDIGDVNIDPEFRFHMIRLGVGGGIRYKTPIGTLRFDLAMLIPSLQDLNNPDQPAELASSGDLFGGKGAFHITIGEAF